MNVFQSIFTSIFVLLISSGTNFVKGQESKLSNTKSDSLYFESKSLFKCNIKLPENYNPDNTHPCYWTSWRGWNTRIIH